VPSDVRPYNTLAMFHEFHRLDKASKDKIRDRMCIQCKKFASTTSQKAVMETLRIIDCPAESHLLPILVKVKKILPKHSSHVYMETHVSIVEAYMDAK